MKKSLLTVALLGGLLASGLGRAQTSIFNIPALPPGGSAPKPARTAPAPEVTPPAPATAPTVTTLPAKGEALSAQHEAVLSGPSAVKAGTANTWDFQLVNTGSSPIHLEHGACDVRFEVLNAAGEVVRPDPQKAICTMQLVITDIAAGETKTVQKIRWEGKDGQGQPVPAGTYTLRAKFNGAGVFSVPASLTVQVQ